MPDRLGDAGHDGYVTLTATRFTFTGSWHVPAPPEEVREVLLDLERYPTWWPEVRAVASLGGDDALVVCRSTLPYSLDLHLHAVRRDPDVLETRLDGDLVGVARWLLGPQGGGTRLRFEQHVRVAGAVLALGSYVARPLLRWNHHRMMDSCVTRLAARVG
jgi:carbon monoxide dehydrogenase subunit G